MAGSSKKRKNSSSASSAKTWSVHHKLTLALFVLVTVVAFRDGNKLLLSNLLDFGSYAGKAKKDPWKSLKERAREHMEANIDPPFPIFDDDEEPAVAESKGIPFCNRSQLRDGYWERVETEEPPYYPIRSIQETLECYGDDWKQIKPWISHDWIPRDTLTDSCYFGSWNDTQYCDIMKNKTLGIIGDSINQEVFIAFVTRLGRHTAHQEIGNVNKGQGELLVEVPCGHKVYFKRANILENFPHGLNHTDIDVLIMNRGAHYVTDNPLLDEMEQLVSELVKFQRQRWSEGKEFRFFWRTSPPGHPHAQPFKEPVNNITAMEELVNNLTYYNNTKRRHFNWYNFKHQNKLVLELLADSDLTYDVLDAYEFMIQRPDLHMKFGEDGLHSCKPGKNDFYPTLLLHFLQQDPYHKSQYWKSEVPIES